MIGRPEELRDTARSLRAARSHIHGDMLRLRAVAESVLERWESPAAMQFEANEYAASEATYGYVLRDLGDLARMLDDAALQLENAIAAARRIEAGVRHWFASQPVSSDGSPPIWEQQMWRYRPGRFPRTGDSEWFAVRRYLRGFGVAV